MTKPCPFCGSTGVYLFSSTRSWVVCDKCGAEGPAPKDLWDSEENALKAWNERVKPEPLTDKEQRIFLAAMERERKVCKQVDEEWRDCREPYEDSLVSVCNEIERKVKGALWKI